MIISECTKETRTTKPRNPETRHKGHTKLDLGLVDPNLGMKECIDYQMDIGYWIVEPKVSDNIQVHKV